jgi:hypothetical protein
MKYCESDSSNSNKLKYTTSIDDISFNKKKNAPYEGKMSEKKYIKNLNKLRNGKNSFVLPQKKILINIKKKFKHNYNDKEIISISSRHIHKRAIDLRASKTNLIKDLNEIEKRKINERIFNDINLFQLKKKIEEVKKALKHRFHTNIEKKKLFKNNITSSSE